MKYAIFVNSTKSGEDYNGKWHEDLMPNEAVRLIADKVDIKLTPMLLGYCAKLHFGGEVVMSVETDDSSGCCDVNLEHLGSGNWKVSVAYDKHNHDDIRVRMIVHTSDVPSALRRLIPYCLKFKE